MIRIATYVAFSNCVPPWCFSQVRMFDGMVNVFETTFFMSVRGAAASLFAVYAAALFAERDFSLAFVIVG
jgi:hypothetical protein